MLQRFMICINVNIISYFMINYIGLATRTIYPFYVLARSLVQEN